MFLKASLCWKTTLFKRIKCEIRRVLCFAGHALVSVVVILSSEPHISCVSVAKGWLSLFPQCLVSIFKSCCQISKPLLITELLLKRQACIKKCIIIIINIITKLGPILTSFPIGPVPFYRFDTHLHIYIFFLFTFILLFTPFY